MKTTGTIKDKFATNARYAYASPLSNSMTQRQKESNATTARIYKQTQRNITKKMLTNSVFKRCK